MRKQRKLNPPLSPFFKGGNNQVSSWEKAVPFLVLTASFLFFFKDWSRLTTHIFLSLDSTVLYYPLYVWVHQHLTQDKLPLICDLVYHGAPVAAVSMAGVLSPVLWLFHMAFSQVVITNLIFLAPFALFLFGTYFLGRELRLSISACLLLAFLWTYNGQRMAQMDHWNVAWACAFFPWAFWAFLRYREENKFFWLLLAGLFWGLNLLSGHPQIVFLEGLFFLGWSLFSPGPLSLKPRTFEFAALVLTACLVASPLILFTLECHMGEGFSKWSEVDRFFHSWTPLNFVTLLFPWFFGRDQYDRASGDYWWQYQFVEMQVAFSIAGLFFILLLFLYKNPQRRWISITILFGLSMAFGKFFFIYPLIQSLPIFSWFRDPARYWHLVAWAAGLGAAYAWDEWFNGTATLKKGRKLALGLASFGLLFIVTGWFLVTFGRPLLENTASWAIQHFLLGDSLHAQSLSTYLDRLPEKITALSVNLDPRNPRVFLPFFFLLALLVTIWNRKNWNLDFQKGLLLALVFADLIIFRMPLGQAFYNPSDIPKPAYPAPQNRSLVLLSKNTSPLPPQYGEMAHPNMNLVFNYPNIVFDANPGLARYSKILADLGWFSWVYKDRDPLGFTHHVDDLRMLGVDQIVSDTPLKLPSVFQTVQNHYPYTYSLFGISREAYLSDGGKYLDSTTDSHHTLILRRPLPVILKWDETRLIFEAEAGNSDLIFQKTFLSGWKAQVNGHGAKPFLFNEVLMGIHLNQGKNQIELEFEPVSLRLGFFLFFLFFGVFTFSFARRLVA